MKFGLSDTAMVKFSRTRPWESILYSMAQSSEVWLA